MDGSVVHGSMIDGVMVLESMFNGSLIQGSMIYGCMNHDPLIQESWFQFTVWVRVCLKRPPSDGVIGESY